MASTPGAGQTADMTRPPVLSRFLLLPEVRVPASPVAVVRRYRLAELRVAGRRTAGGDRYQHIKRVYD